MTTINNPTIDQSPKSQKDGTHHGYLPRPQDPLAYVGSGKNYVQPIPVSNVVQVLGQASYYVGSPIEIDNSASESVKAAVQTRLQSFKLAEEYDWKVSGFLSNQIYTPGFLLAKAREVASDYGDRLLQVRSTFLQRAIKEYLATEEKIRSIDLTIDPTNFRQVMREHRIISELQNLETIPARNGFIRMLHKEGDNFALSVCLSESPYITKLDPDFRASFIAQVSRERDPIRHEGQQLLRKAIESGETAWRVALSHVLISSSISPSYTAAVSETSVIAKNLPEIDVLISNLTMYQKSKLAQEDRMMGVTNYA